MVPIDRPNNSTQHMSASKIFSCSLKPQSKIYKSRFFRDISRCDISVKTKFKKISFPLTLLLTYFNFTCNRRFNRSSYMDFSKAAYCAAVFLRKETNVGVTVNLLTAKFKVAPLNALSLPRVLACLLLANLISSVVHALRPTTFDGEILK